MELRQLRYFVSVATELSFMSAARKLRVAQPALSRQVRQLEDELGVELLERSRRGVKLTGAGQVFFAEACGLLKQSERAMRVARQTGPDGAGHLDLGYVWGLFHSLVPSLVELFRRGAPEDTVHLYDLPALEQAQALVDGRLDAGFIGFAHEADTAGLSKRRIGACEFMAVLPKDHPAGRKARLPLASLRQERFLGISGKTYPGASHCVLAACAGAGFRPRFMQVVERGYTILGLVAGRCGVALLPESLEAMPHPGVVFRRLVDPPRADLFVAWRSQNPNPSLAAFLKLIDQSSLDCPA